MIIEQSNKFKKEFNQMRKRGKDGSKLKNALNLLIENNCSTLPQKYHLHKLKGQYEDCWEFHIEPDWLVIFSLDNDILRLERTGTHSDLFNKISR